jgi:UDPglucose--hexose-1-phosphate uridylyltransferase
VTTGDWVIFAPDRERRPSDFQDTAAFPPSAEVSPESCPFCPGNEHLAGPEIFALRGNTAPDTPGWSVRVVANKYPALRAEENPSRHEESRLCQSMGGCGAHEVVIESPKHNVFLGCQPVEHVESLLKTIHFRYLDLMQNTHFQTVVIFKNHGEKAGTSLRHPHWQIIATPVVPRMFRLKHAVAADYFDRTGDGLYSVLLSEELQERSRVVVENDRYAAVMPYASRLPYETWVFPREHCASFGCLAGTDFRPLAEVLKTVLLKLYLELRNPAFNLTVNTAPRGDEDEKFFLWHMAVLPRLAQPAGFELGSGMAINTVLPEDAAARLRALKNG